jgi:cyclophilin family peptidyl-prolyl cis-trans isomerase
MAKYLRSQYLRQFGVVLLLVVLVQMTFTPAQAGFKWSSLWGGDLGDKAVSTRQKTDATPVKNAAKASSRVSTNRLSTANYALIETQRGNVVIELYPKEAPKTVANFTRLVERGFYNQNGMVFHRVVPGFVVQTGDPTGTGEGGSEERIALEVQNKLSHDAKGIVAMARSAAPNSATSQFYITLTSQRNLDGKYAIFGHVVRGLGVLDRLNQGDKLYGVRLISEKELPDADPKSILGIKLR